MNLGFTRTDANISPYFKVHKERPLIQVFYADDLFLTSVYHLIHQCNKELASEFEMKDLGMMHYFLGLEV